MNYQIALFGQNLGLPKFIFDCQKDFQNILMAKKLNDKFFCENE